MPRHSLASRFLYDRIIDPDVHTSAPSAQGNVRLNNAESALFVIPVGAYNDGTWEFSLEEASNDGSGNPDSWANTATGNIIVPPGQSLPSQAQPFLTVDAAADATAVYAVSYVGPEPFCRVTVGASNVTNGAGFAVLGMEGDLRRQS